MNLSVTEQANAWIEFQQYRNPDSAPDELFVRGFALVDDAHDDPTFAWNVIKGVVGAFAETDLFTPGDTDARWILGMLGAGPLEDLLSYHGEVFIDQVEEEALRERRFLWTLAQVWQCGMSEEVWTRVQQATAGIDIE